MCVYVKERECDRVGMHGDGVGRRCRRCIRERVRRFQWNDATCRQRRTYIFEHNYYYYYYYRALCARIIRRTNAIERQDRSKDADEYNNIDDKCRGKRTSIP